MRVGFRVFLLFLSPFLLQAEEDECCSLFRDLDLVAQIDKKIKDDLPLIYNYQLQVGYLTMPSARMTQNGTIGFGFSFLPPYRVYSLLFQLFDRLEVTGNYWIFHEQLDPVFGHFGFGNEAERAGNLKFALLKKTDGLPFLPEIAVGINDVIGTRRFHSFYIVGTESYLPWNLELTLGWGAGRIQGFFAGAAWSPFRNYKPAQLTFILEYDANNYKKHLHEHSKGREVKTPFNAGINVTLFKYFHFNVSQIRGEEIAASGAFTWNIGETTGIFPKIHDPAPYTAPLDTEAIGERRSSEEFAQELAYAFRAQGLDLYSVRLIPACDGKYHLWMKIINVRYREEEDVFCRLKEILSSLAPENMECFTAVIEADGVNVHEYQFRSNDLERYRKKKICDYELKLITPLREATSEKNDFDSIPLFKRHKSIWLFTLNPLFQPYFGTSTGKFKYDFGFQAGFEGYIYDQVYYSLAVSYIITSSAFNLLGCDILNPSQIINVRSDTIRYHKGNTFHLDNAFLQKSWNLDHGFFTRIAGGYFETAYMGLAWEGLYYPVWANWAIGLEAAGVFKRKYEGVGVTTRIRKFEGFCPTFVQYFGTQYFLNFYYQYQPLQVDFKFALGQFLAKDKGIRIEMSRMFESGLRVGLWWSFTNGNDVVNHERYFDKGFYVSIPMDIFLLKSSRTRLNYSMNAWLRDIACQAFTGKTLYETIFYERMNPRRNFY